MEFQCLEPGYIVHDFKYHALLLDSYNASETCTNMSPGFNST